MSLVFGTPTEFDSTTSSSYISIANLTASKFVVAWRDNSDLFHGTAKVGTLDGTDISFGPEYEFLSSGTATYIDIATLSKDKIIVVYRDEADSNHGTAKVGTISGTTITFGPETEFVSADGVYFCKVGVFSSSGFVVVYRDVSDSNHGTTRFGTVVGNIITFGNESEFYSAGTANETVVSVLDDSKFVVAYRDASNYGVSKIGTVSGTTITFGSGVEYLSVNGPYSQSITTVGASNFVIAYKDFNDSSFGHVVAAEVSGTSITFGLSKRFLKSSMYYSALAALDNDTFVMVYRGTSPYTAGRLSIDTISGTTITLGIEEIFTNGVADSNEVERIDARNFILGYSEGYSSYHGTARIGTIPPETHNDSCDFVVNGYSPYATSGDLYTLGHVSINNQLDLFIKVINASSGMLYGANAIFYLPFDTDPVREMVEEKNWTDYSSPPLQIVSGIIESGITTPEGETVNIAHSGGYPDLTGVSGICLAFWVKGDSEPWWLLRVGFSDSPTIFSGNGFEYGYLGDIGEDAAFHASGVSVAIVSLINAPVEPHFVVVDIRKIGGINWSSRYSINGDDWSDQVITPFDYQFDNRTYAVLSLRNFIRTSILDELVLWSGTPLFTSTELSRLYELSNTHGDAMPSYVEYYGTAISNDNDIFIHGHGVIVSSGNLYVHGYSLSQESVDLFSKGYDETQSSGDLWVHGYSLSQSSGNMFTDGYDTFATSSDLFTHGLDLFQSSIYLLIHGNDEQSGVAPPPLFIEGRDIAFAYGDLFLHGGNSIQTSGDLYLSGRQDIIASGDLFCQGHGTVLVSGDLYTLGFETTIASSNLFTRGLDDQSGVSTPSLFINGSDNISNSENLYINSHIRTVASGDFYLDGYQTIIGSGNLFIKADDLFIASRDLYTEGYDQWIGSCDLFTKGHLSIDTSGDLFINGQDTVKASGDLHLLGYKNSIASGYMLVYGYEIHAGSGDMFIAVNDFASDVESLLLFIGGLDVISNSGDLYVHGHIDTVASGDFYIYGCNTISGSCDLFIQNTLESEVSFASCNLFINGLEPKPALACPILDPTAAIQIKASLIKTYQDLIDDVIDQLGKNVLLEFDPIREPCPNCEFDTMRKRSTGVYKIGGPRPFQRGRKCPYCKGHGFVETAVTSTIKCLTKWNPKDAETFGIAVSQASDIVRLKTYLTDADDLVRAKTVVVNHDIVDKMKMRVRLIQGPIPVGLREDRYCISFWELI